MTKIEQYEAPRGAKSSNGLAAADVGASGGVLHFEKGAGNGASFIPTGHANTEYVAFGPPGTDTSPQYQPARAGDKGTPLERVKTSLRDSPNPIGDIANTLNSVGNLASFNAVTNGDRSHHVTVRLNHSNTSPPPIGMDQGRHHPGIGYTDLKIEADVRHDGQTLTLSNIQGMHSLVHSDRFLPRRQERLGPRTRVANTHSMEIGTDQNGQGYMTVNSGVELPVLRREMPNVSTVREQNLPQGAVRDLLAHPKALNETLQAASLFRPDSFREYSLSQPRPGKFEISTTAASARDIQINKPIGDSPATLESIHLSPQLKATLSTQNKDGQQSVVLENVSGITFNVDTGVKPPLDKVFPAHISVAPKSLTMHTVDGKPVVSYELENPPGSGKIMRGDVALAKLLEAQKESKATPEASPARPGDGQAKEAAPKTQAEWVQKYIIDRGGFSAENYDAAYKAAQDGKKPLVIVLDKTNDPKTLEAVRDGVARGDAVYVYANVNNLAPDSWMAGYAKRNMTGQHEGCCIVTSNLPNATDQGGSYFSNGLTAGDVQWVQNQRRR